MYQNLTTLTDPISHTIMGKTALFVSFTVNLVGQLHSVTTYTIGYAMKHG